MRYRLFVTRVRLLLALAAAPLAAVAQVVPTPPGSPTPIPPPVPGPPVMPNPPVTPPNPPVLPPVVMPDAGTPPFGFGPDAGGIRSRSPSRSGA